MRVLKFRLDESEFTVICTALEIRREGGQKNEQALAAICREYLDGVREKLRNGKENET